MWLTVMAFLVLSYAVAYLLAENISSKAKLRDLYDDRRLQPIVDYLRQREFDWLRRFDPPSDWHVRTAKSFLSENGYYNGNHDAELDEAIKFAICKWARDQKNIPVENGYHPIQLSELIKMRSFGGRDAEYDFLYNKEDFISKFGPNELIWYQIKSRIIFR